MCSVWCILTDWTVRKNTIFWALMRENKAVAEKQISYRFIGQTQPYRGGKAEMI